MKSLEWNKLRDWDGSQDKAFEELCCQLAAHEERDAGDEFLRKAPPDAGVECLRTLPNGDQWGWQAKFFRDGIGPKQWEKIAESFSRALERHPRLTRYYVCVPLDRAAPNKPKQRWLEDKWQEQVEKWYKIAEERGKTVQILWWGTHQIAERLSRKENHGRYAFWFRDIELNPDWFVRQVEGKVDEAGDRYTPETNLTLPVRENLDALGRSTIFWERLRAVALALRKAATDHLDRSIPDGALAEKRPYRSARRRVQRLQRLAAIPGFRIELQGDSRRDGGR